MLEKVSVYQQPSGFADAIVSSWICQEVAAETPVSIWQRDLFAGALSEPVKRASWLGHQYQVIRNSGFECYLTLI